MPGLLIATVVFCTVLVAELPDNSGLASLVLGTRYRAGGVIAGAFAAFSVHVVLAVTCGSLSSGIVMVTPCAGAAEPAPAAPAGR